MMNPYNALDSRAFWSSGVAKSSPFLIKDLYRPKWIISRDDKVATAGSCFAQHITRHLKARGFKVLDVEPATIGLPENEAEKYGYGLYSARYGNIYTTSQLLTLAREALGELAPCDIVWDLGSRFVDGMRPSVEPEGLANPSEVLMHRRQHLDRVQILLLEMDIFVYTLGLTEAWINRHDGVVYPMCPGTVGGVFDSSKYEFVNLSFSQVIADLQNFRKLVTEYRGGKTFRVLLTVSPVPLTATASGVHVLQATAHSKAVLRAVAGELASSDLLVDYFPSFEIVTNYAARSIFYETNLRSVRREGVQAVMTHFFASHDTEMSRGPVFGETVENQATDAGYGVQCEEYLLGAYNATRRILVIGPSHAGSFLKTLRNDFKVYETEFTVFAIHGAAFTSVNLAKTLPNGLIELISTHAEGALHHWYSSVGERMVFTPKDFDGILYLDPLFISGGFMRKVLWSGGKGICLQFLPDLSAKTLSNLPSEFRVISASEWLSIFLSWRLGSVRLMELLRNLSPCVPILLFPPANPPARLNLGLYPRYNLGAQRMVAEYFVRVFGASYFLQPDELMDEQCCTLDEFHEPAPDPHHPSQLFYKYILQRMDFESLSYAGSSN